MNNPFIDIVERLERIENKLEEAQSKPKTDSNKVYSIREASEFLNVATLTIRNHIKKGNLKAQRLGRRYFIKHSDIFDAMDEVKSIKYKRDF